MKKREKRHVPVMLDQVIDVLGLRAGDVVVDCTVGLGGHSAELMRRVGPKGRVIGIDFDAGNLDLARARLARVGSWFSLHQGNFAGVQKVLIAEGLERVHGVLADVGVASTQIDDPSRGFSYKKPGPLDMRMDASRGQPASVMLARMSEEAIAEALIELGDETDGPAIARLIVERRAERPIETTQELMAIVCEARDFTLERAAGAKLHPAARTFQALRILVNRELANLEHLLRVVPEVLVPGGVVAVISFHSGEDRRVKRAFKDGERAGVYSAVAEEPVVADAEEVEVNPRSRSAKLRWARRAGEQEVR